MFKEIRILKYELFKINKKMYISRVNYFCNTNLSHNELIKKLIDEELIVKNRYV